MKDRFFFGYGSLVNRRTHDFDRLSPARIRGWRRLWQPSPLRPVAFLTAVPDPTGAIDGVIAAVPDRGWADLDVRERAYSRHPVDPRDIDHRLRPCPEIHVYTVENANPPNPDQPILLSYIDVVAQGFLAEYGPEGATRFFQTTKGWETPILNDRAAPRYPRHQTLDRAQMAFVDAALRDLSADVHDLK